MLDPATGARRTADRDIDPDVAEILKLRDPHARFAALRASPHPQARFLWAVTRDTLHYCAVQLEHIADNARDLDLAVRRGFGWKEGPFELWQAAGWRVVAGWIADDIAAGRAMTNVPLPAWVTEPGRDGVHAANGAFAPADRVQRGRSTLPVYGRQAFPDRGFGEPAEFGTTLVETDALRLWTTGCDMVGWIATRAGGAGRWSTPCAAARPPVPAKAITSSGAIAPSLYAFSIRPFNRYP